MSLSSMQIILGRLSPLHPYCYLILMYVIVLRYDRNKNEHVVLLKQDTPVSDLMSDGTTCSGGEKSPDPADNIWSILFQNERALKRKTLFM